MRFGCCFLVKILTLLKWIYLLIFGGGNSRFTHKLQFIYLKFKDGLLAEQKCYHEF
jgi:hypothetical protein